MTEFVPISKDQETDRPISTQWRKTFIDVVDAFAAGDFPLKREIYGVRPIAEQDAARISGNLEDYGYEIFGLPEESWRTSICRWMDGYWIALIDLYTARNGASDLVLFVRVREQENWFSVEIHSVHIP